MFGGIKLKNCKVEGCTGKYDSHGYCGKHSAQIRLYGKILERTRFDRNEIIEYENYAEIVLYEKQGTLEKCRTLISKESIDLVKDHKWRLTTNGYVYTSIKVSKGKYKALSLPRFILDAKEGEVVDHINHNPLDNRLDNLRKCTQQENMMNGIVRKHNTSGVTGVSWNKEREKWEVEICVNKKRIKLGRYTDKEEAIQVRKEAERKYFGEFAPSKKS